MRTLDKIITPVNCQYGAPMGRASKGVRPGPDGPKLYNCRVPMISGGYDRGGVYWGLGPELRVAYTKDLSYVHFYRVRSGNEF